MPCAERRGFPIVFLEADVVLPQIDSDGSKTFEIKILNICRRGFEYHLKLRVLVKAVGIFAVAAICRPAAWLGIDDAIRIGPEHAQESFRVHRSGADFHIVGLLENAIAARPVMFKFQ